MNKPYFVRAESDEEAAVWVATSKFGLVARRCCGVVLG